MHEFMIQYRDGKIGRIVDGAVNYDAASDTLRTIGVDGVSISVASGAHMRNVWRFGPPEGIGRDDLDAKIAQMGR